MKRKLYLIKIISLSHYNKKIIILTSKLTKYNLIHVIPLKFIIFFRPKALNCILNQKNFKDSYILDFIYILYYLLKK
jgi:hypothetical protein